MILSKICTTCHETLPAANFRKQAATKDGLQYECKECMDDRAKRRYAEKSTQLITQAKVWQEKNKEKHTEHARKYYNSPSGRINRILSKRLDELLGTTRESFFHLIGLTPSVLLVYLNNYIAAPLKLEDYSESWFVGFKEPPALEDFSSNDRARAVLHWKNLTIVVKTDIITKDLQF